MSGKEIGGELIPFRLFQPLQPHFNKFIENTRASKKRKNFKNRETLIVLASTTSYSLSDNSTASRISVSKLGSSKPQENEAPQGSPNDKSNKVDLKPATDVVAGALARVASQATIHPLDTFKVRLQAQTVKAVEGTIDSGFRGSPLTMLFQNPSGALQGLGSLYKGIVGAASGAGIAIGAYFAFYGVSCNTLSCHSNLQAPQIAFVSGGVAALGSSLVKVPLAVCIRSVQAGVYPNIFAAARSIVAQAGPRGLFTGFAPTVLEDVPDMAIKFAAYESLRQLHHTVCGGRKANPQEDFVMGAVAGAVAAAATTPLDVIKTNMMCNAAARPSMLQAARDVMANGGTAALFRGVGARALSNGINSAVFFCFFEAFKGFFKAHKRILASRSAAASPTSSHSSSLSSSSPAPPPTELISPSSPKPAMASITMACRPLLKGTSWQSSESPSSPFLLANCDRLKLV